MPLMNYLPKIPGAEHLTAWGWLAALSIIALTSFPFAVVLTILIGY